MAAPCEDRERLMGLYLAAVDRNQEAGYTVSNPKKRSVAKCDQGNARSSHRRADINLAAAEFKSSKRRTVKARARVACDCRNCEPQ